MTTTRKGRQAYDGPTPEEKLAADLIAPEAVAEGA